MATAERAERAERDKIYFRINQYKDNTINYIDNMANTKKFFTEEEKLEGKRQNYRDWTKRNPEKVKMYSDKRAPKHCEFCNGDFTNMTTHRRSLKHKANVEKAEASEK